jgi:transcriptional regulator with XRE-family HTH domain
MEASSDAVSISEVKDLLNRCRGEWPSIAYLSGVSQSWISKFVNGKIDNPGHATLCRVRDHICGRTEARTQ